MNKTLIIIITSVLLILAIAAAVMSYQNRGDHRSRHAQNEVHLKKGINLFNRELFEGALEELGKIPAETSGDWRAPYYQASSLIKLNQFELAVPYLDRAFALDAEEARIPFTLGVVYFRLGKLNVAKGYFTAAYQIDPTDEDAKGLMDVMANLESQQSNSTHTAPESRNTDDGT